MTIERFQSKRYKILSSLGSGGMGEVYRARDQVLGREVAIKLLPEEVSNYDSLSRFELEAKALASLSHPNILTIYDFVTENGIRFAVMELLKGETLAARLSKSKLPLEQAIGIATEICEGLAAAHRAGVIHRDLKPANIFLLESGDVKILDFGLARLRLMTQAKPEMMQDITTEARLTGPGVVMGTAAYMSPEQARGQALDERTDIFSFGVVFYEMLTGALPFPGHNTGEFLEALFTRQPVSPAQLNPNVPPELEGVIYKALEKERERRYQNVAEILFDLQRFKQGELRPRAGSKTSLWLGAAAVLISLFLVIFHLLRSPDVEITKATSPPATPAPVTPANKAAIVVLPFTDMTPKKDQEYLSDGLTEELTGMLAKNPNLRVISRTSAFSFKGKDVDIKTIAQKLNVTHVLEGSVRRAGDQLRITAQLIAVDNDSHVWVQTYDRKMENIFSLQEDIAGSVTAALRVKLAGGESPKVQETSPEVYNLCLQGRYFRNRESKEDLEKAVRYFEKAIQLDPGYAPAWLGLGSAHSAQAYSAYVPLDQGYAKAMEEMYAKTRKELERALELDPNLTDAYMEIAWIKRIYDWDWIGAETAYRKAFELEPGDAQLHHELALMAMTLGRTDEAVRLQRRAVELDPVSSGHQFVLAEILWYAGRLEEAETAVRKAMELEPQDAKLHAMLVRIYLDQSKPEAALAEAQKETDEWNSLQTLALAYHAIGKKKEADATLAEFIKKYENGWSYQIAEIYGFRGEADKAFEWLEEAYRQRDGSIPTMKADPLLRKIKKDPRFNAFLKKLNLPQI